ncbi:hypothetical protein OZN62_12835 [Aurantiacibacter sp. MUD11]|uniref:hypothetical protein n=1 Tax=Aurantiacibacter sp. MUD11 TaxID=3003265 RepID=UPI0022AAF9BF|nr:hypothetical protein [Aurantiacibacter sp. MUD11]WAT17783.1 hypothetical protein OZN62_12835 [Aurantiacibacter sp. MUD11]
MRYLPAILLLSLAACDRQPAVPQEGVQRVALDEAARETMAEPSPDTSGARWSVAGDGQAIAFGYVEEEPFLTLACEVEADPPEMVIIRHATALPGQGALFPVLGNGMSSRFLVDATLGEGGWHWEARLPAEDPQLEVFEGTRDLIATLPGRGTLEIGGSRIPGEFVEWCRAGGMPEPVQAPTPETEETTED